MRRRCAARLVGARPARGSRARFARTVGAARVPALVSVPIILPYFWMVVISFTARTGGVATDVLWTACAVIVPAVSDLQRGPHAVAVARERVVAVGLSCSRSSRRCSPRSSASSCTSPTIRFLSRAEHRRGDPLEGDRGGQFPSVWIAFRNSLALALVADGDHPHRGVAGRATTSRASPSADAKRSSRACSCCTPSRR